MNFIYYLNDFWIDFQNKNTTKFPIANNGPWVICLILFLYYAAIKWAYRQQKKTTINYNPILIPYFGFFFGCYFAGLMIIIFLTDFNTLLNCDTAEQNFKTYVLSYLGFLFFTFQIVHLFDTILLILNGELKAVSTAHILEKSFTIILSYLELKFFKLGVSSFLPILYSLFLSINCSYYIRFFSSIELRPSKGWQRNIVGLKVIMWTLLLIQNYLTMNTKGCCTPFSYRYINFISSSILVTLYLKEFIFKTGSGRSSVGKIFEVSKNN